MANHQFKTDASNATLNPLYIQKNVTIESPPTPPPATTKLSYCTALFVQYILTIDPCGNVCVCGK